MTNATRPLSACSTNFGSGPLQSNSTNVPDIEGNCHRARVAKDLLDRGVNVSVIQGGLRAWKKAGLPLESVPSDEMQALPAFDH